MYLGGNPVPGKAVGGGIAVTASGAGVLPYTGAAVFVTVAVGALLLLSGLLLLRWVKARQPR